MENYVMINLSASGEVADMTAFKAQCLTDMEGQENCLSFDKVLPMPNAIFDTGAWYDWRVAHWGCRSDASSHEILCVEDDCYEASFETVWSVPVPLLTLMSKKFPNLNFILEYEDDQESFAGIFYASNGVLIHDIHQVDESCIEREDVRCSHAA